MYEFSSLEAVGDPESGTRIRNSLKIKRYIFPDGGLFQRNFAKKDLVDDESSTKGGLQRVRERTETSVVVRYGPVRTCHSAVLQVFRSCLKILRNFFENN